MIRSLSILLLLLLTPTRGWSLIIECDNISDIIQYAKRDCLVITQLYGVFVQPSQSLGSPEWAAYYIDKIRKEKKLSYLQSLRQIAPLWQKILRTSPICTVERSSLAVFRALQQHNCKILGLSNQDLEMAYPLLDKLKAADFILERSAPLKNPLTLDLLAGRTKVIDGLFCYGLETKVSYALDSLLPHLAHLSPPFIYIDSSRTNCELVDRTLSHCGIEAIVFHYTHSTKKPPFVPAIADKELELLERLPNDQEALKMVSKTP